MKDSDRHVDPDRINAAQRGARSSTGRHPAPAQLSLSQDGGLESRDVAAVRAHLQSCRRCRRVAASLSEVRRILGNQANRDMPATIATRMDQALIAEAAQGNGQWPPAPRRASTYS
ncbi:MAG: zf-HC2 domain-containing protein [Streptosporangiaceae bacterium]